MIQYLFFSDWLMHSTLQAHPCSHKGKTSFFFMAAWYSIVLLYHSLLIHSSTEGHLGCFQILAIVNNAAGEEFFLVCYCFYLCQGFSTLLKIIWKPLNKILFPEPALRDSDVLIYSDLLDQNLNIYGPRNVLL